MGNQTSPFIQNRAMPNYTSMVNYGQPAPALLTDPTTDTMGTWNAQANYTMGMQPNADVPGMFTNSMPVDANFSSAAADAAGNPSGGLMGGFLGQNGQQGWGNLALGAVGGMANLYLGMKQYGLAKKTLAENKRQFELNYDAQRRLTNSQLADRQAARVASNPGAYQSVGSYMDQNGIK